MIIEVQLAWVEVIILSFGVISAVIGTLDSLKVTNLTRRMKVSPQSMLVFGCFGLVFPWYSMIEDDVSIPIALLLLAIASFFFIAGVLLEKRARGGGSSFHS